MKNGVNNKYRLPSSKITVLLILLIFLMIFIGILNIIKLKPKNKNTNNKIKATTNSGLSPSFIASNIYIFHNALSYYLFICTNDGAIWKVWFLPL